MHLSSYHYLCSRDYYPKQNRFCTRDELHALADISEEEGELEEDEETVIHNLLALREMPVKDIMTPRTVTLAFEQGWTIRQVLDDTKILRFGRMPVYEESIDQLSGFVLRSDILMAASMDEWDKVLVDMRKPLMTIGVDDSVDLALETFLKSKVQILAVVDEFGGTAGIVTMEDAIETLLGEEIVDELDEHEDMRELLLNRLHQKKSDYRILFSIHDTMSSSLSELTRFLE